MERLALGDDIEYQLYWETNRFYQAEELDRYGIYNQIILPALHISFLFSFLRINYV